MVALRPSRRVSIAFDRNMRRARADFSASMKAEKQFNIRLRKIADHISDIIKGFGDGTLESAIAIGQMMGQYSLQLEPWAQAITKRMHTEISSKDLQQWRIYSAEMGTEIRRELLESPTGPLVDRLLDEQVGLIKSIPLEAAKRVHQLTIQGIVDGSRPSSMVDEIMRTGEVTRNRATLIARTESARTASVLTQARAMNVGSTHFIWRTAKDASVRPSHKRLDGKTFAWNDPPECDPGHHALPGQIFNCRCYAQPIIPLD